MNWTEAPRRARGDLIPLLFWRPPPRAAPFTRRKGKIFFAQGEATDSIFYIKKGKVKITVLSKQGKEAVVALLGADDAAEAALVRVRRSVVRFTP
jgi:hypothetical protein